MQANLPFRFQEVFKLASLNLNPELFKFGNLSFESAKYICVKDGPQCVIIDTANGFSQDRKDMKAEGMLMHKERNVIAVRATQGAATVVQVFDIAGSKKLKQTEVPDLIVHWKWISNTKIGVVGKQSVFHIDITDTNAPVKMFDRAPQMASCQIMAYDTDPNEKWCYLVGLYSTAPPAINGHMQLYNIERKQQQFLEGYSACFSDMLVVDGAPAGFKNNLFAFCEKKADQTSQRVHIMEIGNPAPGQGKFKVTTELQMDPTAAGDFPVLMHPCPKYGVIFIVTKMGYLFMLEASTGALLYRQRITDQLPFVSARNPTTDGMICINKAGQVLSINVEEKNLVAFIMSAQHIQNGQAIAFKLASRFGLPGCDDIFIKQFNQMLASGDYAGAARVARDAPGSSIRNQETIMKFKSLPPPAAGGPQPILIYFSTLLETTVLNEVESLELVRPVLQQGKMNLVEDWISKGKLTMSEQLGDVIRQYNPQLALKVYQTGGAPDKVIQGLIETNQFDKIMPYCQQTNHKPDFMKILEAIVPSNPAAALGLAKMITARDTSGNPKTPIEGVVQVFIKYSRVQETTALLLEALKGNLPQEGHLQTRLFEINLMSAPQVAEGIFQLNLFSHYDREKVAKMCEQAGLYGRALQNYSNVTDARRVMLNAHAIPKEIMIDFFQKLDQEDSLACMHDLLKSNRQNGRLVAEIATKYVNKIDIKRSIGVLEQFGTSEGMLHFLVQVLPHTDDPDVYYKYIECCARLGNFTECERVIRETTFYNPEKVRDFLKDGKFADPRPLIYLCDMHGYIDDLTRYLYTTKQMKCIEIYLFKVNSAATPKVLGTLLDIDCTEVFIKQLLNSIRVCPIPELVSEFQSRGKLRMLHPWLEARYEERLAEPALHNALAMIYVDSGDAKAQEFLIKNQYYDSKIIGKYCEERNPDLAFTAYKRAWGSCDDELIEVTNKNYLFRMQARYLVERQSPELWAKVLDAENPHRQLVIDQVVQTALPETKNVDEVSVTVSAFIEAKLPNQLIELLERIVLHNSDFAENKNLQNLLILTAIRSDTSRVMDYVNRLDNFDGLKLAGVAKDPEYALYEEALAIYKKFNEPVEAIKVLLYNLENLKAATEFAEKNNNPEVWSELGKAQLDLQNLHAAVDAFIKAQDACMYQRVILLAQAQSDYSDLINYLLMARKNIKDQLIDNELIFSYAKGGETNLGDLETFVTEPNQADIQKCGDRCFDEKLYLACEILYKRISNNQKLATTYVMLKKYQQAFEAAKKASIPKVWKAVCFACVRAKEFRMAALCAQHIIILPDHLEDVLQFYEKFGFVDELVSLLEQGMSLERTHNGIYTDLGIMYAKYEPKRLMDHIRTYSNKLQIPKLIRACEQYQMWPEAVHLHSSYEQQDQAITTMIEHSPSCWRHDVFSQNIIKVANHDLYYRSMIFYLEEEPMLLNDLLKLVATKIDITKAVQVMKRTGHIALIAPFLKSVQAQNLSAVNEALNEIYLENQDFESLRSSIKEYDSFESMTLAGELEHHELLECRRISSLLFRKGKRYQKAIDISKKDELYKDAMETVAESKDPALAEDLLRFLMTTNDKELVGSMLYTCYELIKPDVALEISWRAGLQEFVMPYFIQFMRDMTTRVESVQKSTADIKKKEEAKEEEAMSRPLDFDMGFMFPGMMPNSGPAAIMPGPGMMQMPPGMMGGMSMQQPGMQQPGRMGW